MSAGPQSGLRGARVVGLSGDHGDERLRYVACVLTGFVSVVDDVMEILRSNKEMCPVLAKMLWRVERATSTHCAGRCRQPISADQRGCEIPAMEVISAACTTLACVVRIRPTRPNLSNQDKRVLMDQRSSAHHLNST